MVGVGVLVAWAGYVLIYFGIDQMKGGNNGILDLAFPGRSSKLDTGPNDPDSGATGKPPPKNPGTTVVPPTPGSMVPPAQGGTGGQGYHSPADSIPIKKVQKQAGK